MISFFRFRVKQTKIVKLFGSEEGDGLETEQVPALAPVFRYDLFDELVLSLSLFERKLLICSTVCVVCFYHFGWAPDTFFFHVNTSVLVKDLAFFNHLLCV